MTGDLKGLASKHDAAMVKARVLGGRPPATADQGGAIAAGRLRHLKLLENYTDDDVKNLVVYLQDTTK